jgi:predicted transcriptional regulator
MKKKEYLTIELSKNMLVNLAILSSEFDQSVNWIIEEALKDYIKKYEKTTSNTLSTVTKSSIHSSI